jgi:proton-translocating NADH-quinone oxidoreductase chain L
MVSTALLVFFCQVAPFSSCFVYFLATVFERFTGRLLFMRDWLTYRIFVIFNLIFSTIGALYFIYINCLHGPVVFLLFEGIFVGEVLLVVEKCSSIMLFLVSCVSCVVHLYSCWYMINDTRLNKFLAYLSFFTGSMLVIVLAGNILQLLVGWELVGVSSFLLISFWDVRRETIRAACKALFINKIGDFFFFIAVAVIYRYSETFCISDIDPSLLLFFTIEHTPCIDVACICLVLAAFSKSAQLGFHTWLIDAMEGPTPVSALLHAATMVTAGVYLLERFYFLFVVCSLWVVHCVVVWGVITAMVGGLLAITQFDLKKIIAYSTMSQLGFMMTIVCISPDVALFHLVNHGWLKALLFLAAGVVIHSCNNEQDIRGFLPKLYVKLPITFIIFVLASVGMVAMPLTSSFLSKDIIYEVLLVVKYTQQMYFGMLVAGACTVWYSVRMIYYVFFFKKSFAIVDVNVYETKEPVYVVVFVYCVLIVVSIFSGYAFSFLLFNVDFFIDIKLYMTNVCVALISCIWFKWLGGFLVRHFTFLYRMYEVLAMRGGFDIIFSFFYRCMFAFLWELYCTVEMGFLQYFFGPLIVVFVRFFINFVLIFEQFDSFKVCIIGVVLLVLFSVFCS